MKKFLIFSLLYFTFCLSSFGSTEELSKQATAFYSDNNHVRTMDLILRINEKERSAQDWLLLGNVLSDNNKTEEALYMYQKAIEKDKKCYRAYYNIGNYYMDRGDYDTAINNYSRAVRIKDDNPYIYYNLSCAYIKKKNWSKAKSNLNKAIMYNSKVPEFHYNLAYVYKTQGNEKLAKTYMDNYNKLIDN